MITLKQKLINRKVTKGNSVGTVNVTKTVEVEHNYQDVLNNEQRINSYIKHLEQEMIRAKEELEEIEDIKLQLSQTTSEA